MEQNTGRKNDSKSGGFLQRVSQRASNNGSAIQLENDDKKKTSTSYPYKHSYKVATKLPKTIVRNREFDPNVQKVDPLVVKQQTMIKNRDTKSPFLTERLIGS